MPWGPSSISAMAELVKVIIDVMIQILLEKVKRLAIKSDNVLL